MKWFILIIFFVFSLFTSLNFYSQVSSGYSFLSSSGSYTPITGGVNYNNFTNWTNSAYSGTLPNSTAGFLDDAVSSALLPIGFNFSYNGTTFTQFGICTNGWISLGVLPTNSTTPLGSGTSNNVISALGNDLIGRGSLLANRSNNSSVITITGGDISQILVGDKVGGTGIPAGATVVSKTATTVTISANATSNGTGFHFRFSRSDFGIRYETIGTAPNRTLVVQWTGWQRYTTSGAFGELYYFQIRLNETTNTISFVYNIIGPTSTAANTYQIGLRGSSSSDYNNRSTTSNWSSTIAGATNLSTVTLTNTVKPASGLTFTWTPIPPCTTPTNGGALSSTKTNTTVNDATTLTTTGNGGTITLLEWSFNNFTSVAGSESNPSNPYTIIMNVQQSQIYFRTTSKDGTCPSGNSNIVTVNLNNATPYVAASGTFGVQDGDYISNVTLGNINNTSTNDGDAYEDFKSQIIELTKGEPYSLSVTATRTANPGQGYSAWIDWNGDGVFQTTENVMQKVPANSASQLINVPSDAFTGDVLMRVLSVWNTTPSTDAYSTTTYRWGEIEEYTVRLSNPISLPVELTQFEVTPYPQWNVVKWTTASEQNSSHFDLEMSTDGEEWRKITTKQAAGNSIEEIKYSYIDYNLYSVTYYRLQQFDIDGKFETYGPILVIKTITEKKIVKYINLMGQEVNPDYVKGVVIEIYDDGTMKKMIR